MTAKNFIPYSTQSIDAQDIEAVVRVLKSDLLTQGQEIEDFENEIAKYTGARYCVATSSATAALHLAVAALQIPASSEGISSPITFVASTNCMIYNGVTPLFADIESDTYNLDLLEVERLITERTRLVIPVHFAGQPVDMKLLSDICSNRGISIVEDAAHAIGSKYEGGRRVGDCKFSDMTVFSFHPVKAMTTGEGGAITTNDEKLFRQLKALRTHGIFKEPPTEQTVPGPWYYEMRFLGFNYRLTDIQASLGRSQLTKLEKFIERRREIFRRYSSAFRDVPWLTTPRERSDVASAFHLYVLLFDFETIGKSRAQVMDELRKKGIGTQVHYIPVYTQPFYRRTFGYDWGMCPRAESYYSRALSIPLYPAMSDEDVVRVIGAIIELA